ncbi:hypothetical protein Bcep18194_A6512 [Burkholderia lata]|uniref:Uncharacterized protein n=1 Tax=Burkholderia lata (strain ATCC 17760 / DSM 23089 / LMG 22485 / NCIMB 9086 / R18194 / 383) TaxID=482957 RepID=Q39BR0_BURL3|nr:hypothetical protein Bcep18194_A6512 [Burkholderia lata]
MQRIKMIRIAKWIIQTVQSPHCNFAESVAAQRFPPGGAGPFSMQRTSSRLRMVRKTGCARGATIRRYCSRTTNVLDIACRSSKVKNAGSRSPVNA